MSRNQRKRLEQLEARLGSLTEVVTLYFGDNSTVGLKGKRDFVFRLLGRVFEVSDPGSEDARRLELIRRSVASREPGGGHLTDLIRALLNSPLTKPDDSEKPG